MGRAQRKSTVHDAQRTPKKKKKGVTQTPDVRTIIIIIIIIIHVYEKSQNLRKSYSTSLLLSKDRQV